MKPDEDLGAYLEDKAQALRTELAELVGRYEAIDELLAVVADASARWGRAISVDDLAAVPQDTYERARLDSLINRATED